MPKVLKTLAIVVAVVAVLALVLGGAYTWLIRRAYPKTAGTVDVSGLDQPVDIVRDEYGVAHIYAHTTHDLFFAQGYVHAQERFWQMEFERRTASGRLSEIFGSATLGTDRYLRHFDFFGNTQKSYEMLDAETKLIIDAYTEGVNAYIADRKPAQLGLEFALLGLQGVDVEIEEWTGVDSMIWAEMMIFDQADSPNGALNRVDLITAVGMDMYNDMFPAYRDDRPTIIQTEDLAVYDAVEALSTAYLEPAELDYVLSLAGRLNPPDQLAELGFGLNGGSNSFAVSGDLTTTGMPILANDPHMGVNAPALWFEVGLHCIEKSPDCIYELRGFSLPGVPGILIGHNDRIAWGLTNASFDAEDVYIERINPDNPDQYEVNGEWIEMETRREEIIVRGQDEPVVVFYRSTRNGVVVTDHMIDRNFTSVEDGEPVYYALSYAWTALEPVGSVMAIQKLNRAQNWDEFNEALQYFDAGKQNFLYADVEGNIGYVMPGKVPIRAGGTGELPMPGWNDDYIWTGFIPYDEAPRVFNPAQGFIVTANNPQIRYEAYPYIVSFDHDRGQRAQRITDLIVADNDGISVEDLQAIQTDNGSLTALEVIPYLEGLEFGSADVSAARDRLLSWDAEMAMDSPEAALYNIFWIELLADTTHDQLPKDNYPSGKSRDADVVYFLLQKPDSVWWDDVTTPGKTETRDEILTGTFEKAYTRGVDLMGSDFDSWEWGDLHTITYTNATLGESGISIIENIFNRGPFPVSGSESVPQKTCFNASDPYIVSCIPALRQVVDLSDLSNSQMVHSLGQSGHPGHKHYDDLVDMWRFLEYHPSNWLRSEAEAGKHTVLTLQPSP